MGAKTLMSTSQKNKNHRFFGLILTNTARVIAYFGWAIGGYHDK